MLVIFKLLRFLVFDPKLKNVKSVTLNFLNAKFVTLDYKKNYNINPSVNVFR